jgi:hypothetical protein
MAEFQRRVEALRKPDFSRRSEIPGEEHQVAERSGHLEQISMLCST